jgi:uncharacterized membrane protein
MIWFTLATCSALLSATSAVLQKKILFRLNALEFSFSISLVIVIFTLFIPFSMDVTAIPLSALSIIVVKSILGASAFLLVMLSLQHNQISSALPLLGLTPAAAALLSLVMLGEGLNSSEWIGIGLMIAGCYLLERRVSSKPLQPFGSMVRTKNYYYIYGAVGLFAISSVFDKLLLSGMRIHPLIILFYQHIVYVLLFTVAILIRRISLRDVIQKSAAQLPLIIIVALLTVAYRFTQLEATKLAPVALVLAVKRTSILYASLFGGKIFSEERLPLKLIGALLIVTAGFLILKNVM